MRVQRSALHGSLYLKSISTLKKWKLLPLPKLPPGSLSYRGRNRTQNGSSHSKTGAGAEINSRTFQSRTFPLSPLEAHFPAVLEESAWRLVAISLSYLVNTLSYQYAIFSSYKLWMSQWCFTKEYSSVKSCTMGQRSLMLHIPLVGNFLCLLTRWPPPLNKVKYVVCFYCCGEHR